MLVLEPWLPLEHAPRFREQHIYFGGAGFTNTFYVGLVRALRDLYPGQTPYVYCDSAGSLVGLGYALEVPTEDIEKVYFDSIKNQAPIDWNNVRTIMSLMMVFNQQACEDGMKYAIAAGRHTCCDLVIL